MNADFDEDFPLAPDNPFAPKMPPPTPERLRAMIRHEQELLASPRPPSPEPSAASPGREANGHCAKDNKGGIGHPFARRIAGLRMVLVNAVTEADMEALVAILTHKAKRGDIAAMKLLFAYVSL